MSKICVNHFYVNSLKAWSSWEPSWW